MTGSNGERHELARALGTVARDLQAEHDEADTLAAIVRAAVDTVPGVAFGGISQVQGQQVVAQAPTDEVVRKCDEAQSELREGPCLDAIWEHATVIVDDMAQESRWPNFAARATELGVGSLISFRLFVDQDNLGALNLYGATGVHFGDEAQIVGELFASHAAVALAGARQQRQLSEAVASRDMIGQAKGLVMQRDNITGQQAFDLLVRASQHANIKLTEVARWLVNTHEHPDKTNRPEGS